MDRYVAIKFWFAYHATLPIRWSAPTSLEGVIKLLILLLFVSQKLKLARIVLRAKLRRVSIALEDLE